MPTKPAPPNIPEETPPGRPGGLGFRILLTIRSALSWVYNQTIGNVSQRVRNGVENFLDDIETQVVQLAAPLLDRVLATPDLPSEVRSALQRLRQPHSFAVSVVLIPIVVGALMSVVGGALEPLSRWVSQQVERVLHTGNPGPADAWQMLWRGKLSPTEVTRIGLDIGLNEREIAGYEEISRAHLSPVDLFRWGWIAKAGDGAAQLEGHERGMSDLEIRRLRDLSQFRPGPNDFVRMAIREAWRDDVAAQWGYDADFPAPFAEEMKRSGDLENWSRLYWRAHWELPSVSSGIEMLHRQSISPDEFGTLLRLHDIPAEWRKRILQTVYAPYTRVDIRRMYMLGVLKPKDLVTAHMDIGYDREHAEKMTEFVILDATADDREATKADILGGFRDGILSPRETTDWLEEIRYPADIAQFLVQREQVKKSQALAKQQIANIRQLYVHREISAPEARTRLTAIGLSEREISTHLETWEIEREAQTERPSRATLERFFVEDTITEGEFVQGLQSLGYVSQYINWYLVSISKEKAEKARKAEQADREEQERVSKRDAQTAYQRAKAQLDVDIAELRTAIAENQVALQDRKAQYALDLAAAQAKLTVAQLQEQAAIDIEVHEQGLRDLIAQRQGFQEQIQTLRTEIENLQLEGVEIEIELSPLESNRIIEERRTEISGLQEEIELWQTTRAEISARLMERQITLAAGEQSWFSEFLRTLFQATGARGAAIAPILGALSDYAREGRIIIPISESQQIIATINVAIELVEDRVATLRTGIQELRTHIAVQREILSEGERRVLVAERRTRIAHLQESQEELDGLILAVRDRIAKRQAQLRADVDRTQRLKSVFEVEQAFRVEESVFHSRIADYRNEINVLQQRKAELIVELRA